MPAGRTWLELDLDLSLEDRDEAQAEEAVGALAATLHERGGLGVEDLGWRGDGPVRRLRAWFPAGAAVEGLADALPGVRVAARREIQDPGWVERYNATLHPIDVGRRLTILPAGGSPGPGRLGLHVTPGRAFGTGHHESTRLCLAGLEEVVSPGARVLDLGTGSGILALAAVRLGAGEVLGIDVDPEAVEVARDNLAQLPAAERGRVRIEAGGGPEGGGWDVVTANITPDVILPMLPDLVAALAPRGCLVLSGILAAEVGGVADAVQRHGLSARVCREGEWAAVVARRP